MRLDLTGIMGFHTGRYLRLPQVFFLRGPLAFLGDTWGGDQWKEGTINVISYVVQMRGQHTKLGQTHMLEAQKHQKTWYDKSTRQRCFQSGQKVWLCCLPVTVSSLQNGRGPLRWRKSWGPPPIRHPLQGISVLAGYFTWTFLKEWVPRAEVFMIQAVKEEADDLFRPFPLTINPAKCVLAKKETEYQGFTRVWRWVN